MSGAQGWISFLNLPEGTPEPLALLAAMFFFFFVLALPLAVLLSFVERKMTADLQARVGPNRAGKAGVLQGVADVLKLFRKEDARVESPSERRWGLVGSAALFSTFASLPLGSSLIFVDTQLNVLLTLFALQTYFVAQVFVAFGRGGIEDILVVFRRNFQFISGSVSALISLLGPAVYVGSLNWKDIGNAQGVTPFSWTVFTSPFGALSFVTFLLSGMVIFSLPPFHVVDRGVRDHSSSRLAGFRLGQFYASFAWCILAAVLYLGAWESWLSPGGAEGVHSGIEILIVLAKASALWVLIKVLARALPQVRVDQTTDFAWKVLVPASLLGLLGYVFWTAGVAR